MERHRDHLEIESDRLSAQPQHDAAVLLGTEHAVARVLTEACDEATAYPQLLAAIGAALGWEVGALWIAPPEDGGALRCVDTWQGPEPFEQVSRAMVLAPGEGLPGQVWASGAPAWIDDLTDADHVPRGPSAARAGLRAAFCFPIRGSDEVIGAIEFLARRPREPDTALLATMTSLGSRIGHAVERWRAEDRLRESDARKGAILNAAFDCIITMDADGRVVEVNQATERMFGYRAEEMVGRELAELIIPPDLREPHRLGVERYVDTGDSRMVGHPVDLPAMRADGSEFPVEIAITRPPVPGPPVFTGFIRDVTDRKRDEQSLRSLAEEQAALRRVATIVAAEADQERVFAVVTEEAGRLLGAETANMVRFDPDGSAVVVGEWSLGAVRAVPVGTRIALDGPTIAARIRRSGRPERVESYDGMEGTTAELLRAIGLRSGVGAPVMLAGALWGAMMVSSVDETCFADGSEHRVAGFAELVGMALSNAAAREELAASRARIVEAGDAERRRIERNLHDGAQQRLVALSLALRRAEIDRAGDPEARDFLHGANAELSEALAELRELARGIHPAVLTDRGLVPAIEVLAARTTVPVEVEAELTDRLPDPIEAAAYYLVAEALTNAAKHARASRVLITLGEADGRAVVEIADDGAGGANVGGGSGLRGLCDRVEALGGRLDVASPLGGGTTITARIPIRSR